MFKWELQFYGIFLETTVKAEESFFGTTLRKLFLNVYVHISALVTKEMVNIFKRLF